MRVLILTAMYLLVASFAHAEFKEIDRGKSSWSPSTTGYWIIFAARDQLPGHAFTIWAVEDTITGKFKNLMAYGLYPNDANKAVFGTVPGKILPESTLSLQSMDGGLSIAVTKQMYDYTLVNTEAMRKGEHPYNLATDNCVHLVDLIANSLNLKTPEVVMPNVHPQLYISSLKDHND